MTEHDIQNLIMQKLSEYGRCFRLNVGKVKMADGRHFDTGLPRGFSDLMFICDGKIFFLEVKTEKEYKALMSRIKRNKTKLHDDEQINFLYRMRTLSCKGEFVCSVEQALEVCGLK